MVGLQVAAGPGGRSSVSLAALPGDLRVHLGLGCQECEISQRAMAEFGRVHCQCSPVATVRIRGHARPNIIPN